jgi:hypothetical protein
VLCFTCRFTDVDLDTKALALKGLIQKTSGLMEGHRVPPPLVGYKQK